MSSVFKFIAPLVAIVFCSAFLKADILYETDFSTFADGPVDGQDGWEGQGNWTVTSGVLASTASWQRTRQAGAGFTMAPGDVVRLSAEMTFTGTPGTQTFASLGLAKSNEHTGANMPQVAAPVSWSGTELNIGGVVDTGYDSGDVINVELTFIMQPTTNSWRMNIRLDNMTDGTSFSGGSIPTDSPGTISPETAWEWLDAGNSCFFGMRTLDNSGLVELAFNNVLYENNLPAEDPLPVLVYEGNFCDFADGPLGGQGGWEAQATWMVSGGMATSTGSFQRARQFTPFTVAVGDVIRMTIEASFTGTPGASELARFGISNQPEHTGATVPQVFAGVTWNGTDLTVGGATDTGYDSGDTIQIELTITRGASSGAWQMNTRLSNTTDGTNFAAASNPADVVGSVSASNVWDFLDGGGSALLGMHAFNNTGAVEVAVKSIRLDAGLPAEAPIPAEIFTANFCDFVDGALGGQDGFEAQAPWTIAGGMATVTSNFSRARKAGAAFLLNVDETVSIQSEMSFTGTPDAPVIFEMGMSKTNEHTGAVIPQVGAAVTWSGTDLSFGGATDTGYDSGDVIQVDFRFTRTAGVDTWMLETTIDNITDGTSFTGSEMPTDLPGSVSAETAWGWMDGGGEVLFGMSTKNNTGGVVVAVKNVTVIKNPGAEPVGGDFFAETFEVISGIQTGGTIGDLNESDNVDFAVQRNPQQTSGITTLEAKSVSTLEDPATFEFTLEAAGFFRTSIVQTIEFFDYDAGAFVEVDSRNANRFVDSVVVAAGSGDLSRFVEDGTGCVLTRITYTTPSRRQAYSVGIDQIFWTIE